MTHSGYREAIVEYIRVQASPGQFSHQPRLYQLAKRWRGQPYDDDVLYPRLDARPRVFIGIVRKLRRRSAWDHVLMPPRRCPRFWAIRFPEGKIAATIEAIRTHLPSENPPRLKARCCAMLISWSNWGHRRSPHGQQVGRDTRFARYADPVRVLRKNADELPAQLELASARRLAKSRVETLSTFLAAAEAEPTVTSYSSAAASMILTCTNPCAASFLFSSERQWTAYAESPSPLPKGRGLGEGPFLRKARAAPARS